MVKIEEFSGSLGKFYKFWVLDANRRLTYLGTLETSASGFLVIMDPEVDSQPSALEALVSRFSKLLVPEDLKVLKEILLNYIKNGR